MPAFPASERAVVDQEDHGNGRRLDGQHVEPDGPLGVGDGIADGHGRDAREGEELARLDDGNRRPLQPLEDEQLLDLPEDLLVVPGQDRDRVAGPDPASQEAADADASDIVVVADVGDQSREGTLGIVFRGRHVIQDGPEEGGQVPRRLGQVRRRRAVPARGVDDREIPLLVVGVELDEEVDGLVEDLPDPGVRAVDLVDDDDGPEAQLQGFLEHEPGLRQRAFRRVDEQQDAVDHPEDAFDFAAEVRVAGRIDDVDLDALPDERHVLGDDGDAPLALEIARIEDAIAHLVDIAEELALPHHRVDERRFPMIDMGDDGDVADILSAHRAPLALSSPSGDRSPGENRKSDYYTPDPKPGALLGEFDYPSHRLGYAVASLETQNSESASDGTNSLKRRI